MKKIALCVMVCLLISMLVSCGVADKFSEKYDDSKKDVIKTKTQEIDGIQYVTKLFYNDVEYILDDKEIFFVTTPNLSSVPDEDDTAISWSGSRFGYSTVYYSETSENPLFIYTPVSFHDVYFRSDYNYMTDTFCVSGTNVDIVLSSIIDFDNNIETFTDSYQNSVKVRLISKTNSRIKCDLEIFEYNNSWYSVAGNSYYSELSLETVKELKDNNII